MACSRVWPRVGDQRETQFESSHGPYGYGLQSYGLHSYGMYSYGLYSYGRGLGTNEKLHWKDSAEQSPAGLVLCDQQRSRLPHQLAEPAGRTHTCVQNELKRHGLLETLGLDHVELEGRCAMLEEDEYQQACVLDHTQRGGLLQKKKAAALMHGALVALQRSRKVEKNDDSLVLPRPLAASYWP